LTLRAGRVNPADFPMQLSVIFPAYNEEAALRSTIERSIRSLRAQFESFEILIVDDGSRDRTAEIADELAREFPEVRALRNPRNMGAGHTLMHGLDEMRGDWVIHNAVDYPFDFDDLPKLTALLDDADIVVAARTSRPGYTPFRLLTSYVNVTLLNVLFDLKLSDYNFVQLYRREVIERARPETRSTAFITPETMIRAHGLGYRIKEVPVPYHARETGVATSGSMKVILTSMRDMFKFAIDLRRRQP